MPETAGAYGAFTAAPTRAELERFFFLDDADRQRVRKRRVAHTQLGFGVQLGTVRFLGVFLEDPTDVPAVVADYVAEQLGIDDSSVVKAYSERAQTAYEHAWEITEAYSYHQFNDVEADLVAWMDARAWTTGDGPLALFGSAVAWLIERKVLLPGVSVLARLVARVRDQADQRLWDTIAALLSDAQRQVLEALLVPDATSGRLSRLEQLRRGPARVSGREMVTALERASRVNGLGLNEVDTTGLPARRLSALARHGMAGKAAALRDLGSTRRVATLLATVHQLQLSATDDALDLLDVLMATKLLARAERATAKEKLRSLPRLVKASANLAAAVQVLFGSPQADEDGQVVSLIDVWGQIETVVSRAELAAAMAAVEELTPAPDSDDDEAWRAELTKRYAVVRPFLSLLVEVIAFDNAPAGWPVLEALRRLPELAGRQKVRDDEIVAEVVTGSWRRLVFAAPDLEPGTIDRRAYTFCVLESLHRALRRRDVFAPGSNRWADPRAKLLDGAAWAKTKDSTLASLGLPENPGAHLAELATTLDRSYRAVAERLPANTAVSFDATGELHLAPLTAVPEPASLVELRRMVAAMLPRVDLPEVLLEAAAWTGFLSAFAHLSGGTARLEDLGVSVAAVLMAEACNIGLTPVTKVSVAALTRDRLSHVDQNYVRAETIKAANATLIDYQATIPLAQAWGGGLVASADGMRFVVPVQTINAGPNPRYFGTGRGGTWFNMVNDQVAGISGVFVAGTLRDSLVLIDAMHDQDGGVPPQVIMTDTASYSDIVFGLLRLLGRQFAPRLADMPDQKFWRIDPRADYGPLNSLARGRIDLGKVERHWADMIRLAGSLHTGAVRAYDTLRVLQRDGKPTALGEAVAIYGRIAKTEHMLAVLDDEAYRRQISNQLSIQESRHALARRIFHGQRGELRQRYREGQEDQIGALGLVLNAVTLFTTRYMNAALDQLRAQGHPILEEDVVRLSPLTRKHLNVLGRYSCLLPELPGGLRPLRDPNSADEGEDDES